MNKLKAHNSLKKHIDTLQKITAENEILKYTIQTLENENIKLKKELSISKNKKFFNKLTNNNNAINIQNMFQQNINRNNMLQQNRNNRNNMLQQNNNSMITQINNIEEYNNEINNNDDINKKYRNNVQQFLNRYNINGSLEKSKKVEVPKLLFILYKKKSI